MLSEAVLVIILFVVTTFTQSFSDYDYEHEHGKKHFLSKFIKSIMGFPQKLTPIAVWDGDADPF